MALTNNCYYNELAKIYGPYVATMIIAQNVREISKSLEYRILDSTALDYAAKGLTSDPEDYPDRRLNRVKNYITYIEDKEVKQAIINSYEESLKQYHLIYIYNSIEDEPRKSRIRIVMNILWDTRPHKKN